MRRSSLFIIISLAIALSLSVTHVSAFYDNYPTENVQFNPQNPNYYDGNLRLQLKERADIERAKKPNVHYDKYQGDYYTCSWKYNTNLGTWVCNKDAIDYPESVHACPYGYILDPSGDCAHVNIPPNAHLNARGDGWECYAGYRYVGSGCVLNQSKQSAYQVSPNPVTKYVTYTGYVYYYASNSDNPTKITEVTYKAPSKLPSTGAGIEWTLISGFIGTAGYLLKRKFF